MYVLIENGCFSFTGIIQALYLYALSIPSLTREACIFILEPADLSVQFDNKQLYNDGSRTSGGPINEEFNKEHKYQKDNYYNAVKSLCSAVEPIDEGQRRVINDKIMEHSISREKDGKMDLRITQKDTDMGKVLVLYYSRNGNTGEMAQLVAEGVSEIPGIEVRLKSILKANRDDIFWCDGIALGSPTYLGTVSSAMKKFWEELLPDWQKLDGKIGCAFSSQGGWGGGAELTCQALMTIMMNYGFLVFGVTDYTGHQFTAHYGATQAGEPREIKQKEACRRLGKRLAEWVAVYIDGRKEMHPLLGNYRRNPEADTSKEE